MNKILVFDIETIPDTKAAINLLNIDPQHTYSVEDLRKMMIEYHLKITDGRNGFLRQPFHQVITISILMADCIADHSDGMHKYIFNRLISGSIADYYGTGYNRKIFLLYRSI